VADPVDLRADGAWRVTDDHGRSRRVHAVTDAAGAVWVHVDGEVIVHAAVDRPRGRRPESGAADLEAPMPAQVTAVLVEPGDDVAQGEPLILLDAMKMELPLRAPFDARVEAVHCAAGDRVAPGRTLVDLTRRESSS
jgi:biotin carboxyl carrier protein